MTVIAIWPLIVALVGILMYYLASNGKTSNVGMWMFIVGLFWTVYSLLGKTLRLGG
jgi:hypothetical protein